MFSASIRENVNIACPRTPPPLFGQLHLALTQSSYQAAEDEQFKEEKNLLISTLSQLDASSLPSSSSSSISTLGASSGDGRAGGDGAAGENCRGLATSCHQPPPRPAPYAQTLCTEYPVTIHSFRLQNSNNGNIYVDDK